MTAIGRHESWDAPAWAVEMVAAARVGRLATTDAAGQPHVVPVCFATDAGHLYWAVDTKPKRTRALRRLTNIAENPRVALIVDTWAEDWSQLAWVRVDGTAAVVTAGAERARALDALLAKYPQYRAMDLGATAGAVVKIAPSRVVAWRASASRPGL